MGKINLLVVMPRKSRRDRLVSDMWVEADIRIIGAGSELAEVLRGVSPSDRPHVLLIDLDYPGLEQAQEWLGIRIVLPDTRIVALSSEENPRVTAAAVAAGVCCLCSVTSPQQIAEAVMKAAKGIIYYEKHIFDRVRGTFLKDSELEFARASKRPIGVGPLSYDPESDSLSKQGVPIALTRREREILDHLAEGKSNPQIAQTLAIKARTVEQHLTNLYSKLGVSSRLEAALVASRLSGPSNANGD